MEFVDKYTSTTENEKGKKLISDDAFAIGEMIQNLINEIKRVSLK
jgi:hypothetical protein